MGNMSDPESTWRLLERYRAGDGSAAEDIFQRYSDRLCAMAEAQIGRRLRRRVEAEDIVQSVFRTLFRRAADGKLAVDHTGALWRLLVQFTVNKVRKQAERHGAQRRDVAAEVSTTDIVGLGPEPVAHDPTPDEAAALADEVERIVSELDATGLEVFRLTLEGYSTPEIGRRTGRSRWTVRRILDRIGHGLEARLQR